jgi:hypothetical protein
VWIFLWFIASAFIMGVFGWSLVILQQQKRAWSIFAKKHNLSVKITGAADSSTGTAVINDSLSVSRAEFIATELERRGIPSGRLLKAGRGGIDDYLPTEANRHTKVELFF